MFNAMVILPMKCAFIVLSCILKISGTKFHLPKGIDNWVWITFIRSKDIVFFLREVRLDFAKRASCQLPGNRNEIIS